MTRVPIIDQVDKFIPKNSEKIKNRERGCKKILGGGGAGPPWPPGLTVDFMFLTLMCQILHDAV